MRIAYLSSSVLPSRAANSVHVMKMCSALGKLGHEVILLAPDRKGDYEAEVEDLFAFYGVERTFSVEKLPWPRFKLERLTYAFRMASRVARFSPDLVYSRFLYGSAALALRGRVSVFETHVPVWQESRFKNAVLRMLLRSGRIPCLVTISQALQSAYEAKDMHPTHGFLLARDAADIPSHDFVYRSEPDRRTLKVGYVGQLFRGKGMEVIESVAPRMEGVEFHIVGGYDKDVTYWRGRVPCPNVHFHGFVEPSCVADWIAKVDVCLLPNQRDVRTFVSPGKQGGLNISEYTSPLKMFEYMACGKAILASRLPVLQEVLDDSMALFADPGKPEEWIAALEMLRDGRLRNRLGERARSEFLRLYTWEARAKGILESLRYVLARPIYQQSGIPQGAAS